ncbi:MAG: hypothetical protein H0W71_05690 [Sphingomonas sp.]|nr:hypothetical protein [Sphingomonas sp.]
MMSAAASASSTAAPPSDGEVSLLRLHVLRATYLLLIVGLGAMIVPILLNHELIARGVIPSLLCGVWLLAFIGLKYPLKMLPLLLFEFAWKTIWSVSFGLPQWMSGQQPPTFAEDFQAIVAGVILMPIVIPWGYVWRHYVTSPADRWR